MIDVTSAKQQAQLLLDAAADSPIRQYRYELRRRGKEWERAAKEAEPAGDEVAIELVGSVAPGMKVPTSTGWGTVIRSMTRDGQLTLHIEDPEGRPLYLNFVGPSSPCVVKT